MSIKKDYALDLLNMENLKSALINLNMSTDDAQTQINELKKERVLEKHKSKIVEPTKNDSYFRTKIKEDGRYKNIRSKTYQGLIDKLYAYYFEDVAKDSFTLKDAWEGYLENATIADATVYREKQRWNRFFGPGADKSIKIDGKTPADVPVKDFDHEKVKALLEALAKTYHLKWKEVRNVKGLISNALGYAESKRMLKDNCASDMKKLHVNRNCCEADTRPGDKTRRYGQDEYELFIEKAYNHLEAHPKTISPAATLLIMETAARIGETAALKFSDIDFEQKTWQIARIETVDRQGNPVVEEHGKGKSIHALRKIALSDDAINLILLAKETNEKYGYSDEDYVFCNRKGRISRTAIDHMFRTICKQMDETMKAKSAHDARRTVLSMLYAKLGPEHIDTIRKFAGHASIQQTLSYIYGLDTTETEDEMIRNALSSAKKNDPIEPDPTLDTGSKSEKIISIESYRKEIKSS